MGAQYTKPPLTFEQQVELLEQRGLVIGDRDAAIAALRRISYYRLSAYWYPMRVAPPAEEFRPGSRFEDALALYEFDRRLRLVVLDGVERAEVLARTRITYELSHASGSFSYADPTNFAEGKEFDHAGWLFGCDDEIRRAHREEFVKHFRAKYDGFPRVPLWMASELMSFGTISQMFEAMLNEHKAAVSRAFGVHWRVSVTWLHTLSHVRNICAHHSRLWNRELAIKPRFPGDDLAWAAVNAHRVYGTMCVLRHITKPCHGGEGWASAARALLREVDAMPKWQRQAMGVPTGWSTHAFWR